MEDIDRGRNIKFTEICIAPDVEDYLSINSSCDTICLFKLYMRKYVGDY